MSEVYVALSDAKYFQKAGSPLKIMKLIDILEICSSFLENDGKKGKHGQVFTYINNVLGKEYWPNGKIYNGGSAAFDLDWITKECADAIYGKFEEMCEIFPSLLAIQYSSSYFDETKEKNGLHVYVRTYELDNFEFYNECRLIYMVLLQTIKKCTGYDLSVPQFYEKDPLTGQLVPRVIPDVHNMQIWQRIHMYYSPYKYNKMAQPFDEKVIALLVDKLEDKWGFLFEKQKEYSFNNKKDDEYDGCYSINEENTDKILVDKRLYVGQYNGNDLRWRIASIANTLFGEEDGKKFCDAHFYCDKGSIWQAGKYNVNHLVLNWLKEKGFIIDNLENEIQKEYVGDGYEVKTFLTEEYYDMIKQKIAEHRVMTIQGDPGLGKTHCIGKIAKEMNGVVLTPYLDMRNLYEINGLTIVDSTNRNEFDFDNEACVAVYDQFVKFYWKAYDKTLFVDESHILFKDRSYRPALISLMGILKAWTGKIVIISATPLREIEILGSEETLIFWKKRRTIEGIFKVVDDINKMKYLADSIINKNINNEKYTHICLFGNRSPRMIYDNLTLFYGREIHKKVNIFHRDYEDLGDIDRIMSTEILDKKINIGTSLVYNGVNFKNEGANILVVIEFVEGSSHWCDIVQACTRIRNSKVTLYVIASKKAESEYTLDEKIDDAKRLYALGIDKNLIGYNQSYIDNEETVRELDAFHNEESMIEYSYNALKKIKWIDLSYDDNTFEVNGNKRNLLRTKIDKIIKKELNGEELDSKEIEIKKDGKEYYDNTMFEIEDVCRNFGIEPKDVIRLNNSEVIETNNNCRTVSLATTIAHIRYNAIACIDDDKYWEDIEQRMKKICDGSVMYKMRLKELQSIKQTREKYKKHFTFLELSNSNGYGDIRGMIDDMIAENEEKNATKQEKRSNAGKSGGAKGSPKKKVKDMETGIIYDSCDACDKAIGESNAYVTKYKNRFLVL